MRIALVPAVLVLLGACSGCGDRDAAGGWKKDTLADGRLSFEMPGPARHGPLESASCTHDDCWYAVSVSESEDFAKRMGTTEKQQVRWANFHLLGLVQEEPDRSVEDEGKWTQGHLVGKWIQLALPASPPERTAPVYRWLYAAAWEGKAVIVDFIATQAAYDDEFRGPAVDQARERFVASVTVE